MLVRVLGRDESSPEVVALGEKIRESSRVRELLSERLPDGTIPRHPYSKWDGAHWVLSALAELGYPPGDEALVPLREQVMAEAGFIGDERCRDALDLLASRRLPNDGFPADGKYYVISETKVANRSLVDWGPANGRDANPFVTLDALAVLATASIPASRPP